MMETAAPAALAKCREEGADLAMPTPVRSKAEAWKDTVFTAERPFLSPDQVKNREARKQRYRDQKISS